MAGSITPYNTAQGRRYRVRYRKPDKSQTNKSGFRTKKEAELYLASVTISKAKGEYLDPSEGRRTLRSFENVRNAERLAPLKPSSRHAMETAWRVHVEPKWGGREISTIQQSEIAQWVAELSKVRSAQTVRRAMFVLSGSLAIAAREHVIARNPVVGVTLPPKRRKSPRYLSHAQVAALSSSTVQEHHAVMIELFAYSEPRWGEAVAIRVRHLNMLRRRIRLEDNAVIVKARTRSAHRARSTAGRPWYPRHHAA